jgi:hypothetical protein
VTAEVGRGDAVTGRDQQGSEVSVRGAQLAHPRDEQQERALARDVEADLAAVDAKVLRRGG